MTGDNSTAMKQPVVTTTTTGLNSPYRVWGKTIQILSCLSEFGGLTPREISHKILMSCHDVSQTCRRCFYRGIVDTVSLGGYQLTATGLSILYYNNNNNREQIRNKQGTNKEQIRNKYNKQIKLSAWQGEHTEYEVVVVDTLIEHWKNTGSKYLYSHDFDSEKLQIPPTELKDAIAKLKRDGVIYTFVDKHLQKLKIGLKDAFIKNLEFL